MCFTAIPGNTGFTAVRDVQMPVRRRRAVKIVKAGTMTRAALALLAWAVDPDMWHPHCYGRPLVKETQKSKFRTDAKVRAGNAKQHRLLCRYPHISIRRDTQLHEPPRKNSLADLLDELLDL